MTQTIKSLAYAGCITLVVAIILASGLLYEQNARIQSLQGANRSLNLENEIYKNARGKLLAEKQAAEIRARDLETQLPKVYESLKRDFDIKAKNLRAYMQAEFVARGSGNAIVSKIPYDTSGKYDLNGPHYSIDSSGKMYYIFNGDTVTMTANKFEPFAVFADDGYLSFKADVYDTINAPYEYTYSDTIKYAFHMRGKLFQKKKLYGTGMLSNPNANIVNSDAVLINEFKDPRWGIGPYIGVGISPDLKVQTNFGISIHYSIIKF